jgi:catechol 2,3-dioxygenase-like lactoylglutathione lyase family enzyme
LSDLPVLQARRFLHCCYCCAEVDSATNALREGFGLREAMRTTLGPSDGAILGLAQRVVSQAAFVVDGRGPRTSPALEVQAWVDPSPVGVPYATPEHVGIQAIGIAVPNLVVGLAAAARVGAQPIGRSRESALLGGGAGVVRDRNGVTFDLVRAPEGAGTESRLRHLRLSCRDLDASVAWYQRLGFALTERRHEEGATGDVFGLERPVSFAWARVRLPDEPTELLLQQWLAPAATGAPYARPNHRGLYRAALGVDDTRDAVRRLEDAGVAIERSPLRVELPGTRVPAMWIAFLDDPDGIPIELVERPRGAFR